MKSAKKSAKKSPAKAANVKNTSGFTDEERAAIREYAREKNARSQPDKADGESEVLAKIAAFPQPDRAMAERIHAIVKATAPTLSPKTWYGMPAYARDGNVVCFFQNAGKFKTRYSTLGFSDKAKLDDGNMWPSAYALIQLTAAEEEKIAALIKKAAG